MATFNNNFNSIHNNISRTSNSNCNIDDSNRPTCRVCLS